MGYIIVTRSPRSKKLLIITGEDDETPAEFETEGEAIESAQEIPICRAWSYETVEIALPPRS